jgi:hypothetical protein
VPAELRCFPGIIPVVPGRAKDEAGKAIPSRIIPDHPGDIKYFVTSGVECRMFPDHPGRCRQSKILRMYSGCVLRLFPVVSRSFTDHPGRLPGLCRDVSETVALIWWLSSFTRGGKHQTPSSCIIRVINGQPTFGNIALGRSVERELFTTLNIGKQMPCNSIIWSAFYKIGPF